MLELTGPHDANHSQIMRKLISSERSRNLSLDTYMSDTILRCVIVPIDSIMLHECKETILISLHSLLIQPAQFRFIGLVFNYFSIKPVDGFLVLCKETLFKTMPI